MAKSFFEVLGGYLCFFGITKFSIRNYVKIQIKWIFAPIILYTRKDILNFI